MKKMIFVLMALLSIMMVISGCSGEREKNRILISHSDQDQPRSFPADVEYHYIIQEGYELPKEDMLVTFKYKKNGSHNQKFWMYQVKKSDEGYTVLDTEHEGFYVEDITQFGYSPVSTLSGNKGTFTVTVENEPQYERVVGEHPYSLGVYQFQEKLVPSKTSDI